MATATAVALTGGLFAGTTAWGSPGQTGGQTVAAAPACRAEQVSVWMGLPGEGAAGSTYFQLEFSNTSASACAISGFPRVTALALGNVQIGRAASLNWQYPQVPVAIPPGGTVHAIWQLSTSLAWSDEVCRRTTAVALQVIPPITRAARTIPYSFDACAGTTVDYMSVGVVRPGVGIPYN